MVIPDTQEFILRPTVAEVNLSVLKRNYETIANKVAPAKMMPVIKANAYGHGLIACGKLYESVGAAGLGVAYIEEAVQLRRSGVSIPIHVFGGLLSTQIKHYLDYDIDVTAPSVSKLEAINEMAATSYKRARVHLKIDTGLERIGIQYNNAPQLFDVALKMKNCDIVGVFSHFAATEAHDLSFTKLQLERFLEATHYFDRVASAPYLRHISSSGSILALPDANLDMVRPGLISYGVYPNKDFRRFLNLEPALTLKSQVVFFKVVKAGVGISYGLTWRPSVDTRIVTIPIGHGDGYPRRLSNRGEVLIRGKRYPVVGTVCMDQLMVDIGPDGTAYNSDEVVLLGSQGDQIISAEDLAEIQETNAYEVLVLLNQRIPRVYEED